jgi:hypothetical protein
MTKKQIQEKLEEKEEVRALLVWGIQNNLNPTKKLALMEALEETKKEAWTLHCKQISQLPLNDAKYQSTWIDEIWVA